MRRNILLVSPDYPPIGAPQAFQSARLAKALARAGYKVTVVASAPSGAARQFEHLPDLNHNAPDAIVINRYQPARLLRIPILAKAYRFLVPGDPGAQLFSLTRMIKQVTASSRFDGVISIAEPLASHFATIKVPDLMKTKWRCFWFSDPVPLAGDIEKMRWKWRRKRCQAACATVLNFATDVVAVTEEIMSPLRMLDSVGQWRQHIYPHVFDPDDWRHAASQKKLNLNAICILHSGSLYWKRTPRVLLEAAELALQNDPELSLQIVLQGALDSSINSWLRSWSGSVPLIVEGPKRYIESNNSIRSADILCVIDVNLKRNVHLPSKIADYVAARKPILYIGQPNAPVLRLLKEHPAFAHGYTITEVALAIKNLCAIRSWKDTSGYLSLHKQMSIESSYGALFSSLESRLNKTN